MGAARAMHLFRHCLNWWRLTPRRRAKKIVLSTNKGSSLTPNPPKERILEVC